MENVLKLFVDEASEILLQNATIATLPKIPDSEAITGGMDELFEANTPKRPEGISDEEWEDYLNKLKEERKKKKEELNDSISKAKEDQKKLVKDIASKNKEKLTEIKTDLIDLGVSAGLLSFGTADFYTRVGMLPAAIISNTPAGPGVSPQLAPPMLKSLKAEGDNLSKVYDDCSNKMEKLKLEEVISMAEMLATFGISVAPINSVTTTIKGIMSVAKPLILMVGSSVDGETGTLPEVNPPIEINYNAKDCSVFNYITPPDPEQGIPDEVSPENCSKYEPFDETKPVSCNNCKRFNKKS